MDLLHDTRKAQTNAALRPPPGRAGGGGRARHPGLHRHAGRLHRDGQRRGLGRLLLPERPVGLRDRHRTRRLAGPVLLRVLHGRAAERCGSHLTTRKALSQLQPWGSRLPCAGRTA